MSKSGARELDVTAVGCTSVVFLSVVSSVICALAQFELVAVASKQKQMVVSDFVLEYVFIVRLGLIGNVAIFINNLR